MGEEKVFETKLVKKLRELGVWVLKTHGGLMQRAGIPDLLCCVSGKLLALEIKAKNGRLSELQKHCLCEIEKSGAISRVVYPDQVVEVLCLVRGLQNKN
jgi:Holliday junction resolvase